MWLLMAYLAQKFYVVHQSIKQSLNTRVTWPQRGAVTPHVQANRNIKALIGLGEEKSLLSQSNPILDSSGLVPLKCRLFINSKMLPHFRLISFHLASQSRKKASISLGLDTRPSDTRSKFWSCWR